MQQQYTKSSILEAADAKAREDLDALAQKGAEALKGSALESLLPGSAGVVAVRKMLADVPARQSHVIVVDRNWRVVMNISPSNPSDTIEVLAGHPLDWKPIPNAVDSPGDATQGTLDLPNGSNLAAAYSIPGASGYVVACCSADAVHAPLESLTKSLPALAGVTFLWTSALLGIGIHMVLTRLHGDIERERQQTRTDTMRKTQNLIRTRDAVVFGLAKLADSRDPETGDHLERISLYSTIFASVLQRHPKFCDQVTPAFVKLIGISSALHDIGKVGIEDSILRKPANLTSAERARMQTHPTIGGECLQEIEQRLGSSNFLQMARKIALAHHERWDGTGYPMGLRGTEIPLAARIVGITDVYDALATKRIYKPALPHKECVAIIRSQAGKHFDPDLVEVWLTIESKFREVAAQYAHSLANGNLDPSPPDNTEAVPQPEAFLVSSMADDQERSTFM